MIQTVVAGNQVVGSIVAQVPSSVVAQTVEKLTSHFVNQIVASTIGHTAVVMINYGEKSKKLNGLNFKRCQ